MTFDCNISKNVVPLHVEIYTSWDGVSVMCKWFQATLPVHETQGNKHDDFCSEISFPPLALQWYTLGTVRYGTPLHMEHHYTWNTTTHGAPPPLHREHHYTWGTPSWRLLYSPNADIQTVQIAVYTHSKSIQIENIHTYI